MFMLILLGLAGSSGLLYLARRGARARALAASNAPNAVTPEEVTDDEGITAESVDELAAEGEFDTGTTAESADELAADYSPTESISQEAEYGSQYDMPYETVDAESELSAEYDMPEGEATEPVVAEESPLQQPPVTQPGTAPGPKTKPKPKSKPQPKPAKPVVSLRKALNLNVKKKSGPSLPSLPWLADREKAEPGFVKAIIDLANEFGGDPDKIAAYMSKRSDFNPAKKLPCPNYPGGRITAHRCGRGIWGFVPEDFQGGFSSVTYANVADMSGIEQIQGPLRSLFTRFPILARDPALHVILRVQKIDQKAQPDGGQWANADDNDLIASRSGDPTSTKDDERIWQEIGNMDLNGTEMITVGELRDYHYRRLNNAKDRVYS